MADDSEKRFKQIMDKLYQYPRPKTSSSSGVGSNSVQKGKIVDLRSRVRVENGTRQLTLAGRSKDLPPQQCRPWDRGDLMKRLAKFKAVTWFGKPKAISPINCARRGWVNVEMDTIACEACGSRLLFSTPFSWTFQQVEKAAAVFSLKLDNGHKLLCPWTDNICDESLALFPPTPAPALVEGYKERASALLQLSALPMIASTAIDYMMSPQLECLLKQSSSLTCTLENGIKLNDNSSGTMADFVSESAPANLYFQALKIISLCGWELHLLPYIVDCKDRSIQSAEKASFSSLEQITSQKNHATVICSSTSPIDADARKENRPSLENQSDPASSVLDCKLCGACVGLWAFKSISRPLEVFNLIDSPDANDQNDTAAHGKDNNTTSPIMSNGGILNLKLTIAGGLPPAKQNFRPRVSFPIVSRHLRAEFGSDYDIRNHLSSNLLEKNQVTQSSQTNNPPQHQTLNTNDDVVASAEVTETLKRKRNEDECCNSDGRNHNTDELSGDARVGEFSSRNTEMVVPYSEGRHGNREEASCHEGNSHCSDKSTEDLLHNRIENSGVNDTCFEDAENGRMLKASLDPTCCPDAVTSGSEVCKNDLVMMSMDISSEQGDGLPGENALSQNTTSQVSNNNSSNIASCSAANATAFGINNRNVEEGDRGLNSHNLLETHASDRRVRELKKAVLPPANGQVVSPYVHGNNLMPTQWDSVKEFDPIRQHRPFCSWIAPMDGEGMPGWKLALLALDQEIDSSHALTKAVPYRLSEEADDPIVSVRKLFTSPLSKRLKGSK